MFLVCAFGCMFFSQDAPNGSYRDIRKARTTQVDGKKTFINGISNYRCVFMLRVA